MTNMKTIYDQYKENWDLLASIGNPSVAEAAKNFYTFADMERAIGYTASTVKKWAEGHNNVSKPIRGHGCALAGGAGQRWKGKAYACGCGKHKYAAGHHATGICRQSSPRAGDDGLRV
jgi:hypothetical protein